MEQTNKNSGYGKIVSFLILLLLGLTAFNFGGSIGTNYLEIIVFAVAMLSLVYFEVKLDKVERNNLFFWLIPFVFFAFFVSISIFWISFSTNSIYTSIVSLLGIAGFMGLGLLLKKHPEINLKIVLSFILGGLALIVLSSLIFTLVEYGPFYVTLHENQEYFYDGSAFLVSSETGWLSGFSFVSVTLGYAGVYAFILASTLPGLLFLNPRSQKIPFYFILGAGLVGLLFLVLLPYKTALLFLIPVYALGLLIRFFKIPTKIPLWEKITSLIALGITVILVLFMLIMAIQGTDFYSSSSFLSRIFDNSRLTDPINQTINATLKNYDSFSLIESLFGMNPYQVTPQGITYYSVSYWGGTATAWPLINLKTFEFSTLMEGGLMAFFGFCVFMVFAIMSFRSFLHRGTKQFGLRIVMAFLVLAYFLYMSFLSSSFPFIREPYSYVSPFRSNSLFLIIVFLIGYSYTPIFGVKKVSSLSEDVRYE
jgi:hypothetical protein